MTPDVPLLRACAVVDRCAELPPLSVRAFFNEPTFTVSYVVSDPASGACAIVDSVVDFDAVSGRTSTQSADEIVAHVRRERLTVEWLLETHIHADHLSAAAYLQTLLGGRMAIGEGIVHVQSTFGALFNADLCRNDFGFDRLFGDGDDFQLGDIPAVVLYAPGHTPADVAYVIGDAVFVGDTILMPDFGTARADFPGGDARRLFHSIRRLLKLPPAARVFLCHDYGAPGRPDHAWETTVEAQRAGNIHVRDGIEEETFVALREARDQHLELPRLMLSALQVNLRGGRLPEPEDNGVRYLKIPLNGI